jgi:hypothetical protein
MDYISQSDRQGFVELVASYSGTVRRKSSTDDRAFDRQRRLIEHKVTDWRAERGSQRTDRPIRVPQEMRARSRDVQHRLDIFVLTVKRIV